MTGNTPISGDAPAVGAAEDSALGHALVRRMPELTWARIGALCLENIARNEAATRTGQTLAALRGETLGEGDSAIVIAAGPSVHRHDPLRAIMASGYRGAIIATESAMLYCLRNGVVPDLVVTVDPHDRILRWFGDPKLDSAKLAADDYFRRQDMEEAVRNERAFNAEVMQLLDRYGPRIRIALATTASAGVVERCLASGMRVYWFNPMLDDPDGPQSATRDVFRRNRLPCVNAGGNVGTACWMMAHAVLGKRHVALAGIDFSYYDDTDRLRTQYYYEIRDLVGEERLNDVFVRVFNPHLGQWFYTDPAYMWYRQCFLELAPDAECKTYNCTEGGILFGDGIEFMTLTRFLSRFAPGPVAQGR